MRDAETAQPRNPGIRPLGGVFAFILLIGFTSSAMDDVVTSQWRKYVIGNPTGYIASTHYTASAATSLPTLGWARSYETIDSLLMRLPADIVIAASEYGFIGSQHPKVTIIDLVGLHDRQVARHGFSAEYLFSRKPDILWMPHSDYTWARKEILDHKSFAAHYDYYPGAYDYGLAIRRDSRFIGAIQNALEKEFSRLYNVPNVSDYKAAVTPAIRNPAGM